MSKSLLIHGECLEKMKRLPNGCIDAIITDPPYGTTACKWAAVIPFTWYIKIGNKILYLIDALIEGYSIKYFEENKISGMWEQLNRIIKPNGAIALFGSEPFSSALRMSNIKNYKYDWIWKKSRPTGFANAKKRPLKTTENILVFNVHHSLYESQDLIRVDKKVKNSRSTGGDTTGKFNYGEAYTQEFTNYPKDILNIGLDEKKKIHPTQKPVALMEYLIKTYTNEGELVLDFTMGSGSTGVACKNTNRRFIGIEKDEKYFKIAQDRINKTVQ